MTLLMKDQFVTPHHWRIGWACRPVCLVFLLAVQGLASFLGNVAGCFAGEVAPDHSSPGTGSANEHWAFLPPALPALPHVENPGWCHSPIDRFILVEHERHAVQAAPPASPRHWLRRIYFDLIGLPPTVAAVRDFLADESPHAKSKVVDRILASAHYGERWGRHWLDVVRYADSNGLDENVAYGNAWRYRDYVVRAWNMDKPYDRFLQEQLAGDLLADDGSIERRHELLVATGFLSLGPKVLAEVDMVKMRMDIVDEQIDTLGRALLGVTLGCARCHDHKFDPISTNDYYSLAGIFGSTHTMDNYKIIAHWHEHSLVTPAEQQQLDEHAAKVESLNEKISQQEEQAKQAVRDEATSDEELPEDLTKLFSKEVKEVLEQLRAELKELEGQVPTVAHAMGVKEGEVIDEKIRVRGDPLQQGEAVARGFPVVLNYDGQPELPAEQSGRRELAEWLVSADHPLTARVFVNRLWRWHFGQGLVATPDNFGVLGERPVNVDLLDWMARRLIADDWSVKTMHRRIVLSNTYGLSNSADDESVAIDPDNRLQWRTNVRRLEAEPIRDAILTVSGRLDTTMGGSMLHVKNREFLFNHTSQDGTKYDSLRRSIYLPIVRNHLYDVFSLFDYADASVTNGNRPTSTVAPQALFMLNSQLLLDACKALVERLPGGDVESPHERIRLLYERILGRPPLAEEVVKAEQFLQQFDDTLVDAEGVNEAGQKLHEWEALCQILLASNEFIYLP